MDTIFSSASGHLKTAIKIIRISGKKSKCIPSIFFYKETNPRVASFRKLYDSNKRLLDNAVVIYFPGPNTVTGEDICELHIHGSLIVEKKIYNILSSQEHFRVALPGEFTKRALLNGIIDLTQAEGLNDLINAETQSQLDLSISQYEGSLLNKINLWRNEIVRLLSKLEALIDFSDEELPTDLEKIFVNKLLILTKEMKDSIIAKNYNEKIRNGFVVTLIGKPNVGKSSFINYLSKRNISIVTDEPGTTRDILEISLDFGGFPVFLSDTAGIRNPKSKIEKIGITKAIKRAKCSDIILILSDKNDFSIPQIDNSKKIFYVHTKADLKPEVLYDGHYISVKTGRGVESLIDVIVKHLYDISPKENAYLTRERHVQYVNKAILAFERSIELDVNKDPELLSEELRSAANAIGSITNAIDVEDVLDDIFSSFCIGK